MMIAYMCVCARRALMLESSLLCVHRLLSFIRCPLTLRVCGISAQNVFLQMVHCEVSIMLESPLCMSVCTCVLAQVVLCTSAFGVVLGSVALLRAIGQRTLAA